ncbi:hypothetical protein GQ43DRAFT_429209 [Delitschia confertaspora ATCC 74209]|uniref:Uncharacterized protein n=1 Tax=Delitschia confertaspora ATCC 74209 TaxID=1513339 RepID=A0A9P4MYF3_9PLEO|nr:hypothetical protein GQ43DRAFT_429209 [Delitschia confertaspora ATCC 74209]
MTTAAHLPVVTEDDLRNFHATHFAHAPLPKLFFSQAEAPEEGPYSDCDDGLGFYHDGVKRTLTDAEVLWCRNSEIQAIMKERRLAKENKEPSPGSQELHEKDSSSSSKTQPAPFSTTSSRMSIAQSEDGTPKSGNSDPSQKLYNRKRRNEWKDRKKKQKDRKRRRDAARLSPQEFSDEDEESDEWDPWHQATGPDVQRDIIVDLDY